MYVCFDPDSIQWVSLKHSKRSYLITDQVSQNVDISWKISNICCSSNVLCIESTSHTLFRPQTCKKWWIEVSASIIHIFFNSLDCHFRFIKFYLLASLDLCTCTCVFADWVSVDLAKQPTWALRQRIQLCILSFGNKFRQQNKQLITFNYCRKG